MALTKLNNKAVANVTTLPVALGDMVLVSSATASGSATIDFTLGDYKEYQFYFVNIHPSASDEKLGFNLSTDGGSNYNVAKTTTYFLSYHNEADTQAALSYDPYGIDLAQGTGNNFFCVGIGNENDECLSGSMTLFNPSSTTYVKHFIGRANNYYQADYSMDNYFAGYGNTTSAVNAIRFQMSSGNIDDGIIKLYGVKKS
jgi:hypothetical protein